MSGLAPATLRAAGVESCYRHLGQEADRQAATYIGMTYAHQLIPQNRLQMIPKTAGGRANCSGVTVLVARGQMCHLALYQGFPYSAK